MSNAIIQPRAVRRRPGSQSQAAVAFRAFTLIELMVAVALMSVIILGLVAMFNETQRAFRVGMMQTDILESGRIATGLIANDLEQISPAYLNVNDRNTAAPNFMVEWVNETTQKLPATSELRTNFMDDVFFLTRRNQTWTGIGYFVRTNQAAHPFLPGGVGPVGTLYRFETNATTAQLARSTNGFAYFTNAFENARLGLDTNVSQVLDGVVDFQVRTYSPEGIWINHDQYPYYNPYYMETNIPAYASGNLQPLAPPQVGLEFFSNAVPANVGVEIGVLERKTLEQYRSIPSPQARDNFFINQAAHVHLFRQRIAVRNMDPTPFQWQGSQ